MTGDIRKEKINNMKNKRNVRRVAKWEKNFGLLILSIKKSFQKKLTTLCPKIETPLKINKSFQSISRITHIMLSKILRNQKQKKKLGDGKSIVISCQQIHDKSLQIYRDFPIRVSPL